MVVLQVSIPYMHMVVHGALREMFVCYAYSEKSDEIDTLYIIAASYQFMS